MIRTKNNKYENPPDKMWYIHTNVKTSVDELVTRWLYAEGKEKDDLEHDIDPFVNENMPMFQLDEQRQNVKKKNNFWKH